MSRKSRELRINQTRALMNEYESAGFTSDRSYRFMCDMVSRLDAGRGISKGQRKYLDDLIDQGMPTPKNELRVNEILDAATVDGMQNVAQTLKDFAYKLGKGWSLSENQEKFLTNLLAKAKTLSIDGRFRPSDEMIIDLENAIKICKAKSGYYWEHRPGTAMAYYEAIQWLDLNRRSETRKNLLSNGIDEEIVDGGLHVGEEPIIDKWVCDKLLKAVKNPLNELKNPKYSEGSMAWYCYTTPSSSTSGNGIPYSWKPGVSTSIFALIAGSPTIISGCVSYPCLINGTLTEIISDNLKKRRPRAK